MKTLEKLFRTYYRFLLAFSFLLLSCLVLEQTRVRSEKPFYDTMLDASVRTEAAFSAIKEEKLARGLAISAVDDPNGTGLIGDPYTEITTTLGNLEAKRSTTNPNISAMIVDMLDQCGVKKGDTVAVNLSSSFPAVNIAVLCALDAVGADGIVTNSVGASTYGANLPDFTYLDMEYFLREQGYIQNHSGYFSMGGAGDRGKEMPEEIKTAIIERLTGYGFKFLDYEDITENVNSRMAIYTQNGLPSCLINAGGNLLSFGGGSEMVSAKNGVILPGSSIKGFAGLIPGFLEKGVPVIHLLNMKSLLPSYGLPVDPIPLPKAGEGEVYHYMRYHLPLAAVLLILNLGYLLWAFHKFPHRRFPL